MNAWLVTIACALSLATAACAQSVEEIPLRAPVAGNGTPLSEHISYRQNNYDELGFNRLVDQVAIPTLTVYRPAKVAHRGAAVVICPGGGYQYVVIDREGHMLARYFQKQGITAVVLKYRLPDPAVTPEGLPWPQQDALAAIQYVRAQAVAWDIDPRRVGIVGSSAGGHLAGSTTVLGDAGAGSRPDFALLLYPVITLEAPHAHVGSRQRLLGDAATAERVREFSLNHAVKPGGPPCFLVHARDDRVVPFQNSELFVEAVRAAGEHAELLLVDKGGHGFALGRGAGSESSRWPAAFLAWLDQLP